MSLDRAIESTTTDPTITESSLQHSVDALRRNDIIDFFQLCANFIKTSSLAVPKKEEIDTLFNKEFEKTDFNEDDLIHFVKITTVFDFFNIKKRSFPSSFSHLATIYIALVAKIAKKKGISAETLMETHKGEFYKNTLQDLENDPENITHILTHKNILIFIQMSKDINDPKFAILKKNITQIHLEALRKKNYVKFSGIGQALVKEYNWVYGVTVNEAIVTALQDEIKNSDFKQNDLEQLVKIRAGLKHHGLDEDPFINLIIDQVTKKLGASPPAEGWPNKYNRFKTLQEKIDENTYYLAQYLEKLEKRTQKELKQSKFLLTSVLDEQSIQTIQQAALRKQTEKLQRIASVRNNAPQHQSRTILIGVAVGIGFGLLVTAAITIAILTGGLSVPGYVAAAVFLGAWISQSAAFPVGATIITAVAAVVTSAICAGIGAAIGWLARKFGNRNKPNTLPKRSDSEPPSPPTPPRTHSTTDLTSKMRNTPGSSPAASPKQTRKSTDKEKDNDKKEEEEKNLTPKGKINKNSSFVESNHSTQSVSGYSTFSTSGYSSSAEKLESSGSSTEEEETKFASASSSSSEEGLGKMEEESDSDRDNFKDIKSQNESTDPLSQKSEDESQKSEDDNGITADYVWRRNSPQVR